MSETRKTLRQMYAERFGEPLPAPKPAWWEVRYRPELNEPASEPASLLAGMRLQAVPPAPKLAHLTTGELVEELARRLVPELFGMLVRMGRAQQAEGGPS